MDMAMDTAMGTVTATDITMMTMSRCGEPGLRESEGKLEFRCGLLVK